MTDPALASLLASGAVKTVGDILEKGEERAATPAAPARFAPARLEAAPPLPQPGIYFDMDEETYHGAPALSTGGIKKLAASPMLFWASCPWLNEGYEPPEQKDHFDVGHAYHARILEGREAFAARFAVGLDKADFPGVLTTIDDIKAAFPEGVKPRGKSKRELFDHLRTLDSTAELWDDVKAEHEAANPDKTFISAKTWRQLEIAAAMIERDPELNVAFTGGWPEVSLFWICATTSVPMKARMDYLKFTAFADLKSIAGSERSMENAVRMAIANYRYGIQPVVYMEGAKAVRELIRQGAAVIDGTDEQKAWAAKWATHKGHDEWLWVFQQKGIAPVARGVFWPRGGTTHVIFSGIITMMKRRYREFNEVFGCDPWLDIAPIYDLADEDLPPWATEI